MNQNVWLRSKKWDLTFLTFSSVLAFFPLALYYVLHLPGTWVNYIVALVVGGPHLYSTFSMTFLEKRFRARHRWFLASSFLLPIGVIYLALHRTPILGVKNGMTLLLTVFFFWASIHVLHQITYIVECYREKQPGPKLFSSRVIDYGLIFSSLYPMAMYKLVRGVFRVDKDTPIPFPAFARVDFTWIAVSAVFAGFLIAFILKCLRERREGRLNPGATILIGCTVMVAFWIPWIPRLDVAFQGFNTWHSFQYLALVWYINSLRKDRHEISSPIVEKISGPSRAPVFYFAMVGCTLLAVGAIFAVNRVLGLDAQRSYYIVILSSLLIHYYQDHLNFFQFDAVVRKPGGMAQRAAA